VAAHLMLPHCLLVPMFLKMQLAEMSLVLHHPLPSQDQILCQEEDFVQFVLMQFPSQQDRVVQQNVQGFGNKTAATEPQPDKNILLQYGRSCLAIL
jgi:hypothetical protein